MITKREDVKLAYGDVISSAKFNQIFESLISDIESLESQLSELKEFLKNRMIVGLTVTYDPASASVKISPGYIMIDGKPVVFDKEITIAQQLQQQSVVVYDKDAKTFSIKQLSSLGENDIPIAVYTQNGFDYSIRPAISQPNAETYERLIYQLDSAAQLGPAKTKAIQYLLGSGKLYSYDYKNERWLAPLVQVKESTATLPAGTYDSDYTVFTYQFVPSAAEKHLVVQIQKVGDDATAELILTKAEPESAIYSLQGQTTVTHVFDIAYEGIVSLEIKLKAPIEVTSGINLTIVAGR